MRYKSAPKVDTRIEKWNSTGCWQRSNSWQINTLGISRSEILLFLVQIRDILGAFHSTKITGSNFRNFRWSNGTGPTASQNSRLRGCNTGLCCLIMADFLNIFAALEQGDCQISCTILDRNDDVIRLAAVACFMRKGLTFVNGYFEVTTPAYLSGEFENHFRMTGQRVSYWHKK